MCKDQQVLKKLLIGAALLLPTVSAQQAPTPPAVAAPAAPATNLDAFLSQTGVLTVRESLGSKKIPTLYGSSLNLEAVKLYTPGKENDALLGIAFQLNSGDKYASTRIEFIDSGEIDDMIKATEYMVARAPKAVTTTNPEFKFTSKSDAVVGMYYSTSDKKFSGFAKASTQTAYMDLSSLTSLSQALKDLKALLK